MIKKSGFTLAEVLTTLMVIGVVAAMTIPTLMNSTNDQQLKVAYKKALSVLGQGVQLMTAKEEQCTVNSNATLADCFARHAISGTRTDNVIKTSDGMDYMFIYNGSKSSGDSSNSRTLEEICGNIGDTAYISGANAYNGTNAACGVVVDLNGSSKGKKGFSGYGSTNSVKSITNLGSEQLPIIITGTGVRPLYDNGTSTTGYDYNQGWKWMFGDSATPTY